MTLNRSLNDLLSASQEWRESCGFTAPLPNLGGGQLDLMEEIAAAMLREGEELQAWKDQLDIDRWAVDAGTNAGDDRVACFYLCIFLGLCAGMIKPENAGWADIFQQIQDKELDLTLAQFKAMFGFPVRKRASDEDVRKMAEGLGILITVMDPMGSRDFGERSSAESRNAGAVLFLWGGHYQLAVPPSEKKVREFKETERWKQLRDGGLGLEN